MSYIFHKHESMYPPRGFDIEVKGRMFYINPKGSYASQLKQVQDILRNNDMDASIAKSLCIPHWCSARPELCRDKDQKAQIVSAPKQGFVAKVASAVKKAMPKKRRGGCSSCGGGRVV